MRVTGVSQAFPAVQRSKRSDWVLAVLVALASIMYCAMLLAAASPQAAVDGRVIDAGSRPVPGARIAIFRIAVRESVRCPGLMPVEDCFEHLLAAGAARAVATSGPDGRFTLRVPGGLRDSDMVWVEARDQEGKPIRASWPIGPNRSLPVFALGDIHLNQRLDLIIQVVGNGRPIPGAEVDFGMLRNYTDENGETSISLHLPPRTEEGGWHTAFTVRADGFAGEEWGSGRIGGLQAGTARHVMNLEPETIQRGRVLAPSGRPLADVLLAAVPAEGYPEVGIHTNGNRPPDRIVGEARTDAMGEFTLHGLRAGTRYRLTITSDDPSVSNDERVLTAGDGLLDIVMGRQFP